MLHTCVEQKHNILFPVYLQLTFFAKTVYALTSYTVFYFSRILFFSATQNTQVQPADHSGPPPCLFCSEITLDHKLPWHPKSLKSPLGKLCSINAKCCSTKHTTLKGGIYRHIYPIVICSYATTMWYSSSSVKSSFW